MTFQQVLYDSELFIDFFGYMTLRYTSKHGDIRLLLHAISQAGNTSWMEAKAADDTQRQEAVVASTGSLGTQADVYQNNCPWLNVSSSTGGSWTPFSIIRAEEELAAPQLQAKETGSRKPKLN